MSKAFDIMKSLNPKEKMFKEKVARYCSSS
jgi:hypothetical protein